MVDGKVTKLLTALRTSKSRIETVGLQRGVDGQVRSCCAAAAGELDKAIKLLMGEIQ